MRVIAPALYIKDSTPKGEHRYSCFYENRKSFTFIELITIIVIITLVSALAIVKFRDTFDGIQLQQFGKNISYLSEYVRARAIAHNRIYCLTITLTPPTRISAAYLDESGTTHLLTGKFAQPLQAPALVDLVSIEPPDKKEIFFYPDGTSDQAVITFATRDKNTLIVTLNTSNGRLQVH